MALGDLLERCVAVAGSGAELVWVANELLLEQGVEPWTDLPLWLGGDPELEWIDHVDPSPAIGAGTAAAAGATRRSPPRWSGTAPTSTRPAGPDFA